jgi:hypothetical protein
MPLLVIELYQRPQLCYKLQKTQELPASLRVCNIAIAVIAQLSLKVMRIDLNLSGRPFTNHRLFWMAVSFILLISLWLSLSITSEKARVRAQADELQNRIKDRQAEVEKIKQEAETRRKQEQKTVLTEQEIYQLESARQLIFRRSFSWSRLIRQIEDYVPPDTRIVGIKVQNIAQGPSGMTADLEISAVGKNAPQLTEMMERFEKSGGIFTTGDSTQGQATETGEVPFTIKLQYRVLRGVE